MTRWLAGQLGRQPTHLLSLPLVVLGDGDGGVAFAALAGDHLVVLQLLQEPADGAPAPAPLLCQLLGAGDELPPVDAGGLVPQRESGGGVAGPEEEVHPGLAPGEGVFPAPDPVLLQGPVELDVALGGGFGVFHAGVTPFPASRHFAGR